MPWARHSGAAGELDRSVVFGAIRWIEDEAGLLEERLRLAELLVRRIPVSALGCTAGQPDQGERVQVRLSLGAFETPAKQGLGCVQIPFVDLDPRKVRLLDRNHPPIPEAPVMVIPCLLQRLPEGASVADTAGFYGSILPAAWSFMLALRSRGLGSAWTTLHLNYERDVAEILGIPETVTQTALLPVAYYTGEDFKSAPRRPVEEIVYVNGWKQR